jgi:glycine dehydrogenase subunit 2
VDVLHLNLHKTFSTPHGGGGPAAGPVCVTPELEPFLPVPRVVKDGEVYRLDDHYPLSVGKVHAFYGNFGILVRAYSYILSMGNDLKEVSQYAVLNANYIKERLQGMSITCPMTGPACTSASLPTSFSRSTMWPPWILPSG